MTVYTVVKIRFPGSEERKQEEELTKGAKNALSQDPTSTTIARPIETGEGSMPWYRGVECKSCKAKIALKKLSGPEEGPLDPRGSPGWVGAGIDCPTCKGSGFYGRPDFIVFETFEPIPGEPKGGLGGKPN
jgi:hypothetical protein